mmetsp:Transcript_6622/g.11751  ORF Transcript_6622/g.11751 Transcript_6622/m.11751 type:complete len:246 (+) Transcript_6622:69-806(+)
MATITPSPYAAGRIRHLFALLSVVVFLLAGVSATDEAGTKYLEEKSKEADVVTLPSGLRYKVLKKGNGSFHPMKDSPCLCHYAGTLIDGTEFDSSYSRGSPTTFAPNQVIKGWTEAMQLMVEGDKWELYIPSDLAYGDRGSPPKIPGDSALVFTIEMIEIQGEKVFALKCNPTTLEDCDDRMKNYILKAKNKYGGDADQLDEEMARLGKIAAKGGMKEELMTWIDTRMFILQQMLVDSSKMEEEL